MKVLLVSTAERTGGGAIAARRLMVALNKNGIDAKMLVRDRQTDDCRVVARGSKWHKAVERLRLMLALRKPYKQTWNYDLALDGIDILSTPEYREADVVHLHWVNQGMLSLDQLRRMLVSGKRIVWTLHDEWPFRGIKHLSLAQLQQKLLQGKSKALTLQDEKLFDSIMLYTGIGIDTVNRKILNLEAKHFAFKQDIYRKGDINFVGCSQWIAHLAQKVMPQARVCHINNCIPQDIFQPQDQREARAVFCLPANKKLILFTCQKVTNELKGFSFLLDALQHLPHPKPHLVVVGGGAEDALGSVADFPREAMHFIPYVNGEAAMAGLYAAVDCFVTPSLQDNLPNTIAEAMSCGTPCVGFNTGGIPEMISHMHNGYVAEYCNSKDLAQGIVQVLEHPEWREAALQSARQDYSEENTAKLYGNLYGI